MCEETPLIPFLHKWSDLPRTVELFAPHVLPLHRRVDVLRKKERAQQGVRERERENEEQKRLPE